MSNKIIKSIDIQECLGGSICCFHNIKIFYTNNKTKNLTCCDRMFILKTFKDNLNEQDLNHLYNTIEDSDIEENPE